MEKYYAIDFDLNITPLGLHPSFGYSAYEAAQKLLEPLGKDVLCIASRENLIHLSNELEKVFFEKSGLSP